MNRKFYSLALGFLLLWAPLAFFYRAADGFTLTKEIVAVLALVFLGMAVIFSKPQWIFSLPLVQIAWGFALWMIMDSFFVGTLKMEVLKGSIHILLIAGTLTAVVFACGRGMAYERLLLYALGAGAFMSLYGIFQSLGGDRTNWTTHFESRAFSTLGNPDYLGGHLAGLAPLALVLTLRASNRQAWLWLRLMTLILVVGLVMTRVRGAEIALLAAVLFIALSFLGPWGRDLFRRNRPFILATLGMVVILGAIWVLWRGGLPSLGDSRISVEQRLATYQVALEMVKENPLFGVGVGQVGVVYPSYQFKPYEPADYPNHPYFYTEHIHNEFLQFWVEGGTPGLVLFLAVLTFFVLAVGKVLSDTDSPAKDKELLLGVTAGTLALLVQALSNFPFQIVPTAVLFGLFLAAPLSLRSAAVPVPAAPLTFFQKSILVFCLLAAAGWGARAVAASIAYRDTAGETNLAHGPKAVYYGNRLIQLSPVNPKAWNVYAKALEVNGQTDAALAAYQKSFDLNPHFVENLMAMADLKAKAGEFQEALDLSQRALAVTPNYVGPLWVEAYAQYQLKQWGPAADCFQRFIDFAPQSLDAWVGLGVCDSHMGKKREAVAAWQRAHQLDPQEPQVIQFLKGAGVKL